MAEGETSTGEPVTRAPTLSRERPLSLNSRKVTKPVLRQLATALELPGNGTIEETRQMIEGKLTEMEREPRHVQVILIHVEGGVDIVLEDAEGPFLETRLLEETEREEEGRDGGEPGDADPEEEDPEATRRALQECREVNAALQTQVEELSVSLNKSK